MNILLKLLDHGSHLIGALPASACADLPRYHEGYTRLINEDGVRFVYDGRLERPLDQFRDVIGQTVAQKVEASLLGGKVSHIGLVRLPSL